MNNLSKQPFIAAAYLVVHQHYCSKSLIQRKLQLGYLLATEIIDFLLLLNVIIEVGPVKYEVLINDIDTLEMVLDSYYSS